MLLNDNQYFVVEIGDAGIPGELIAFKSPSGSPGKRIGTHLNLISLGWDPSIGFLRERWD